MRKVITWLSMIAISLTSLASFAVAPAAATGTISNGSFEAGTDPGSYTTINSGDSTSITDWTVNSGTVDYIGTYWQAADGSRSVDLDGDSQGSISQTFATDIGGVYTVTFSLSGNPDGSPSVKDVTVSATGGTPQDFTFDTSVGNSHSNMMWQPETYSFTATAANTTLTFASQTAGDYGPVLDNVSIVEQSPECNSNASQTIVSDSSTTFSGDDGAGNAVAVTPTSITSTYWTANIPGATWIWSTPTVADTTVNNTETFTRAFTITGTPLGATLEIAADNYYTASVNGNNISGTAGTATDQNFASAATYNIPASDLVTGPNTLTVVGENEGVSGSDSLSNPAGILYSLTANDNECSTPPPVTATCPAGTTQSATALETDPVNSSSYTPTAGANTLTSGQPYLLVSTGTWQNNNLNAADTAYASEDNWATHNQGYNISPYFLGPNEFQLQVNGGFVNWGSYSPTHTYSYLYTGTGAPVNLLVFDGDSTANPPVPNDSWYGDNSGSLSVAVYACVPNTPPPPSTVTVTLVKYLDGSPANATSANSTSFPMTATWSATNIGSGTGSFSLGPTGFNNANPYQATTADMTSGASYSATENIPSDCSAGNPYALVGYSTGSDLPSAVAAGSGSNSPSQSVPNLTNITSNQYIVVWNETCQLVKVHILKYLDGQEATSANVPSGYQFPMTATWMASNLNGGASASGNYVLGNNYGGSTHLYGADTSPMTQGASYTTSEITTSSDPTSKVVDSIDQCVPGDYYQNGYSSSGTSFSDAATSATSTLPIPLTNLTSDGYIIVWNNSCPTTGSLTVEKDTTGGNGTFNFTGDLGSFSITTTGNSSAGSGTQTFTNLTPGNYTVSETSQNGWTMTDSDCVSVAVTAGSAPICHITNSKNPKLGEIRGTKYVDRDGDGTLKDGDHHRLGGVTIQLTNPDNSVVTTVTDSHGNYRFTGLASGTYKVSEVVPTGWVQTVPAGGSYTVTLKAGQIAKKKDFGNFKPGTISGMKFDDVNGNGRKDSGDAGLQGWTIKISGPHGYSNSAVTDSNGNYSFSNLGPGIYTLSEVMQSGWRQTAHPGQVKVQSGTVSVNDNFGNTQLGQCPSPSSQVGPNNGVNGHKNDNDCDQDDYGYGNQGNH